MSSPSVVDRWITVAPDTARLPERLLLSQASGGVVFISGAGISMSSGMPDFRGLVLQVYRRLDPAIHAYLNSLSVEPLDAMAYSFWDGIAIEEPDNLTPAQVAEVRRFTQGDYDVVLGMLERRLEGPSIEHSRVRLAVSEILDSSRARPSSIHLAIMGLAERGGVTTTLTTNFDRLLEEAMPRRQGKVRSFSLGGIPRPGRSAAFGGVLHIHGSLQSGRNRDVADLVLTDHDFGEFYLRRRVVPDLIYDAARLFNLVLVGYSANDAPMRYLLNAVAADGRRFDDLKERFAFVGEEQLQKAAQLEDWKGRGITPIPYSTADNHRALSSTLSRWAEIAPRSGKRSKVASEIRRITSASRALAPEVDRDLFDHFVRRAGSQERARIAEMIGARGATPDWIDAMNVVIRERR